VTASTSRSRVKGPSPRLSRHALREPRDADSVSLFGVDVSVLGRHAALDAVFFDRRSGWQVPFWLMLMLSVGIATLGLSENSGATVIGAMIVAPLGQPIVALGAAMAIG
jgi:hypothetical protein